MGTNPRTLGKYELHERLGRGGMAEVWKAFDPQLRRYVAIKFVQTNLRADPTFATRFIREAQAVASLRHPNIIRIYDFETTTSESDDSMAYMVMDYVEGRTLADYIHSTSLVHKFPPAIEIVHLFTSIGAAVDYAHQHGMIHRDIKPANILLDQHNTARNPVGEPILSDFGIVKMMGTATGTLTNSSVGTPLYISPEQAKGQPGDEKSDIYSLGVTLYEVCTGVPPFRGDSPFATLHQHISEPPPLPTLFNPALPPALEAVILRCLAKEPAERFPSASALTSALAEALNVPTSEQPDQPTLYSLDAMNEATLYKPLQGEPTERTVLSSPAKVDGENTPAFPSEMMPTLLTTPVKSNPVTPAASREVAAGTSPPVQAPSPLSPAQPPSPIAPTRPRRRRGLYMALIALLIIVLAGSGLGAFFVFSAHTQPQAATTGVVGHGFFTSSGQVSGLNVLGINDTFQISLSNIPNPPAGKSYYAWLLPDNSQSEAVSIALGPLTVTHGIASLHSTYIDPQHTNLIGQFSRLLISEEDTNPPPQSYTLDKKMWRYYAEIPQTPVTKDCVSVVTQLSDLCHLRHLLSNDPELQQVNLPSGLNYWFLNNVEDVQNWAGAAVNRTVPAHIRHKIINILYVLDGLKCIQQDLQHASTAPGTDNTPDDNTLNRIAAIPLLNCALTPTSPGYLIHIHNHLSAIVQSPGVLADQVTLATQINTELNNISVLLGQMQVDAQRLVGMDDTQLTQAQGLTLRNEMNALAMRILSGGNDPTSGKQEPGVAQISNQIRQLATFDIKVFST